MKVTLEQIDELRKRVNVSYEEAKKTLEKNDGDLIKSIIELEKKKGSKDQKKGGFTNAANKLLALKLSIKNRDGDTILNVPVVIVLLTFLMSFWTVIILLALALVTSCQINVYRDKGINVNNIKKNVKETVDRIKDKSEEIFKDDEEEASDTSDETENEIIIE
ncbi:MAG TPA: ubiquitin-associated protein [Sedimentibacter sp.]|mgnify:FL=1|jgi:NACalpha-BTF3-like transcription factor|nr:ubiquitin-associated protein [Tissierellia bacterium]HOW23958.1 ubiquitin-associated protein [Sedimentibacter sp.]HRC81711.1 ubiquitin-associated protein [Sedimentibacter sp.]